MKLRLLALAAALALVPPALAAGPSVDARAYLVEDGRNGEVLLAHNEARQVPIASLTKMMTVLLALERAQLTDEVTVTPHAAAVGESSVNLRAGERLTVRDLVEASLIQSANDAAWALAEHVGRGDSDRFVSVDTVILGCTHYPLIRPIFQRVFGRGVTLVFSAEETAREVAETLERKTIANEQGREGVYRFLTTGDPERFRTLGERFLQLPLGQVEQVAIAELEAAAA